MQGPKLATMAWRNLWRNRRRTVITLFSIAFGTFLAVLMTGMMDRSFADFIDTAAKLGAGHVSVQHPEYRDTPTLSRTVDAKGRLEELALADEDVARVVERISGQAMLSTATDSFGVMFMAYDPTREDTGTFSVLEGEVQGRLFEKPDDDGIVLGKKLAENLGVSLGEKVVYTVMGKDAQIVSGLGRLRGTVETGTPGLDAGLALLPIDRVRETLGYGPGEATRIAAFLSDSRQSAAVASRLGEKVGPDATALAWDQVQPELASFIAMKVGGSRFMEILVALLVAAGIFNTLFVSVMERLREFGIMMAIGYSPFQLFRLVVWESVWLALTGLVLAAAVTAWPYWYLSTHGIDMSAQMGGAGSTEVGGVGFSTVMQLGIYPEHLAMIVVAVLFATVAAGLYPAWRAGRVVPVESIKLV